MNAAKKKRRIVVIPIWSYKGGVAKTTTSMVLAQGLSLRGHRVLVIDTSVPADPRP